MSRPPRRTRQFCLSRARSPADKHATRPVGPGAPQQSVNARHELGNREWLDHVIIGANRKTAHAFAFFTARRQHDDGQAARRLARPHPPADFKAGDAGQHPIKDDEVRDGFGQPDFGFVASLDPIHGETFGLEIIRKKHAQGGFVLDHENARRRKGRHRTSRDRRRAAFIHVLQFFPHVQTTVVGASDRVVRPFGRSIGKVSPVTR